jgi:cell division protein FtsB
MRGTPDISQGSIKKKKPLGFLKTDLQRGSRLGFLQSSNSKKKPLGFLQRFANMIVAVTILVVFLFMMQALIKNGIVTHKLFKEKEILRENQLLIKELEKQIEFSKTPYFIEHYAREKLDMLKSGEFVIILESE